MKPLCDTPVGEKNEIKWIIGKQNDVDYIRELGITEGDDVTVINNFKGSVIVALDDIRRFALGSDVAYRIKVG